MRTSPDDRVPIVAARRASSAESAPVPVVDRVVRLRYAVGGQDMIEVAHLLVPDLVRE